MLGDVDAGQDDTGYESGNSHKQNNKNNAAADISIDTITDTTPKLNASISVNCITSTSL